MISIDDYENDIPLVEDVWKKRPDTWSGNFSYFF
jgi:hypothetical protein